MNNLKRIILICLMFILSLNFIYAYEYPQGSISIKFNNSKAGDVSFSLYKIGDCSGSLGYYELNENFSNLDCDLNNLKTAKDCENVIELCLAYIEDNEIFSYTTEVTNKNGNIVFDDLPVGLYLIKQDMEVLDFKAETILVQLPNYENSKYNYNVESKPKYIDGNNEIISDEYDDTEVLEPKTNDNQQILPYVVTLGVSSISLALIYLYFKNENMKGSS